ncbi:hypothetical protein CDL15_Pgr026383 [Punica granatum]|uniref:Uncharacterized protein n=1 Tax=Punica granatum TaxID=22663 RepID=A0A218XPS1_PUNGR|nr:hypothetical protein CDL15_Pgr026383 [Punica granatum]
MGSWSRFVRRYVIEVHTAVRDRGSCDDSCRGSSRPLACEPWVRVVLVQRFAEDERRWGWWKSGVSAGWHVIVISQES